jgi:hypothetical protein
MIRRSPAIVKINEINPRFGMVLLLSALSGYQLNRSRWICSCGTPMSRRLFSTVAIMLGEPHR